MVDLKNLELEDATDEFARKKIEDFYIKCPEKTLKTLVLKIYWKEREEFIAVVIRGDLRLDLSRLKSELGFVKARFASKEEMQNFGLVIGYVSPIDCSSIKVIGDKSIIEGKDYYDGGNRLYFYRKNVNYPRDFEVWKLLDVSLKN